MELYTCCNLKKILKQDKILILLCMPHGHDNYLQNIVLLCIGVQHFSIYTGRFLSKILLTKYDIFVRLGATHF